MDKKILLILFSCLLIFIELNKIQAGLNLKRDDFIGNTNRRWWRWHHDGPSTPMPSVRDGYVLFSLVNPIASWMPFCDAAFWDGYPSLGGPYGNCEITLRVKTLNPHRYGSRGWGLWYTEGSPNLQRQMWFMEVLDDPNLTGLDWWRAETSNGRTEATHYFTELDQNPNIVDNMQWHTYKIVRNPNYIEMFVDGSTVLYSTEDLPTENLAFHLWIDNLVYEHVDPDIINIYHRGWVGRNELVLDYVQILSSGNLGSTETPEGIRLLRDKPNEIYTKSSPSLWKQYSINSPSLDGGNVIFLITARAEQYMHDVLGEISDPDAIRLMIGGIDYQWSGPTSINGAEGTVSKTLLIEQTMDAGSKTIDVYGNISPLLYDVTAIGSEGGGVIFDQVYNETATGGADFLWKEINFLSHAGEIAIYISGTADEDPTPSRYGYTYSDYGSTEDDEMRIVLDDNDYGYQNDNAFWGNRLFGEPKSVLINSHLSQGAHRLRIYANNTPTLYRIVIYGENDDVTLPITLSSFNIKVQSNSNLISWRTESEVNNLGFNLYRAFSENIIPLSKLEFLMINPRLINGAGNSNLPRYYSYKDTDVKNNYYYWYQLEDVDFNGNKKKHPIQGIFRSESMAEDFKLYQNYPNPFNPTTHIRYGIPTASQVKIEIYNTLGQKVTELIDEYKPAGYYLLNFNASKYASGIYIYRMVAGNYQEIKKMILIK
jgi:hypothetical protein